MLTLEHSQFICVPKTGSMFCTYAMVHSCEYAEIKWNDARSYHTPLSEVPYPNRPTFGFVRHPVAWYVSYWRHRMEHGWDEAGHVVDRVCRSDKFEVFMDNVLRQAPGWMGRYFSMWLGHDLKQLAFVGRNENLLEDLIDILNKLEEPFDEDKLRAYPRTNQGNREKFSVDIPTALRRRIEESEAYLIETYYE
tara:strand:- start:10881 stop:11459 length:579 start_codon:yes stop_codon:yes gene_type:complete